MKRSDWLFWNVDTQIDFVYPDGKLYVPGAEKLLPAWERLTRMAAEKAIRVMNTADFHYENSAELSANPDYVQTFPPHCMAGTRGAEYIPETNPENPVVFDWNREYDIETEKNSLAQHRNIVIRKDAFDVFSGNPYTEEIVGFLKPETVVVYGVTTNVCVNDAVVGLAKRIKNVLVVEDAIKELPNIPLPFENWKKLGVELIGINELEKMLTD